MDHLKVALVHDWLTGQRGGEKVLEVLAELFPRAPIYTLFHFRGSQREDIEKRVIRTSFLQRMPFLEKRYRFYLPLFPVAAELFDLQRYDLVVSSSHCVVKGIIPSPDALHICYIHSPVRYAWNQYPSYFSSAKLSYFSRFLVPPLIHYLRMWDQSSSARVDHFIANSGNVARRVMKYYRREADIVHPPVDTDFFQPAESLHRDDFFLIVSALVPYKRIDLAVEAFNKTGETLNIVGTGPEEKNLKSMSRSNIKFLGAVESADLRDLYRGARALILPGEEDFGISVLEAQACGTPVIAYGRGGALETVVSGATGVLYEGKSVSALLDALDKFRGIEFNKTALRANAVKYSCQTFKQKICSSIEEKWAAWKGVR